MNLNAIQTHPALAGMRACKQWLVYVLAPSKRAGKMDKIPLHYVTGIPTGVNDPASWTDCETAVAAARAWGPQFGVGFAFTEAAGWFFIDLDSCYDAGQWSPLAQQVCTIFAGACVEISTSGKGLHVFGRGTIPPHVSKNIPHHAELYHTDRFAALSGDSLAGDCNTDHTQALAWFAATYFPPRLAAGAPVADEGPCEGWNGPTDDDELIRRALKSKSAAGVFGGKASFADLWDANVEVLARAYPPDINSSEPYDRSSADAAIHQHLAFWTGKDKARMDRIARRSKLVRDKWDDHGSYVELTIDKACTQQKDVLADKPPPAPPATADGVAVPTMTAVEGSTFLGPAQAAELFAGCVYVVDVHRALVPGGRLLKPEQFKAYFGGYSFAMDGRNERTSRDAWEAFTQSQVLRAPRADGTCFRPDLPYGEMVRDAGRIRVNTYSPVKVPRKAGDPTLFLNHVAKLLPDGRDRKILLGYLAALVQEQGTKFQWAIVLQGVEGNGKTLFSRCVGKAVGPRYVHWVNASKLGKDFNAWMADKTFYAVEDIHTSAKIDVIEALKPMIAGGDGLEIEAKGVDQVSTEICGNFLFNTNHKDGLRKTRNDRRFAVFYCAQQNVDDLARDGMGEEYFQRLYTWLRDEDGYAIVSEYLWTLPIPDEYNPATGCQRAPRTSSTDEAIENSLGPLEQQVQDAIEHGAVGFRGGWISSIFLARLLGGMSRGAPITRRERAAILDALGYVSHPALGEAGQVHNHVSPDGAKPKLYIHKADTVLAGISRPADVARAYAAAQSAT